MAEENQLTTLPEKAEATPPPVEPDEVQPTAEAEPIVSVDRDEPPDPTKLKDQIDELERRRKKAEEDAIYWRKQKAEARADFFRDRGRDAEPPQQPPAPTGVGPEPKPADFQDYDAYVDAKTKYEVKRARSEWEREEAQKREQQTWIEREQNLYAKLNEGYEKYSDFEEVAFDRTAAHITPLVKQLLADCDHPADVVYYLNKNRIEGVAISRMTPFKAARAIAQLEAKLTARPPNSPPPPPKKTTSAPPPINPVGTGGSGVINKDPDKMTQREYEEWRAAQGARKF
jgi:hypothetical protein